MSSNAGKNTRRDFLRAGVLGFAAAAFVPRALRGRSAAPGTASDGKAAGSMPRKLLYRTLGRSGLRLPIVSFGAGGTTDPALVRAALDAGIVHVDTARGYGRGANETMIGTVLKGRPRDSFVIGTKSANMSVDNRTGIYKPTTRSETFLRDLDASLEALGLEYVDIFYVHGAVRGPSIEMDAVLSAFEQAKQSGKARWIGISTHRNEPEVIRAAIKTKIWDVVLTSYNFRQPHLAEVESAIAEGVAAGIGIVAMKTQAGVFWDPDQKQQINMSASLKWSLQNENVCTGIPGITSFDQLEADLGVMDDLALSLDERKDLRLGMAPPGPGLFCGQCGACVAQCPRHIDIPTAMRSYMYAYGHRRPAKARETLEEAGLGPSPCGDCASCPVRCSLGIPVRDRVRDIARLAAVPAEFLV